MWCGEAVQRQVSGELEVVHNNAAHAVLGAPYRASATLLRHTLGRSAPMQRRTCHAAIWTFFYEDEYSYVYKAPIACASIKELYRGISRLQIKT